MFIAAGKKLIGFLRKKIIKLNKMGKERCFSSYHEYGKKKKV